MMIDRGIGRCVRAAITTVENAIAVLVAILGITNQTTGQNTERRSAGRPSTTFECAQASTDQSANDAADRPGTLIEGGSTITVSGATGQQAAKQQNRQDGPCESGHFQKLLCHRPVPVTQE
jgi:hypothetical protein